MANTITLAQWSQRAKEPLVRKLVSTMLRDQRSLLDKIPFVEVDSQTVRNQTWKGLPAPSYRPIGQAGYSNFDGGGVEDVIGHVYDLGGVISIDHIYMKDKNVITSPRMFEMERAREGLIRHFNAQFVQGLANNPNGFAGLNDWLADNPTQIKDRASAAIWATQASMDAFIDDLHEMFTFMADNRPDVILTNLNGQLALESTLRRSGYLKTITDAYDRHFPSFNGVPIVDVGSKTGDRGPSSYIIPYSSNTTDFYFVKFGEDYVTGLQFQELGVEDIGYTEASHRTTYQIVISWVVGIMITHRYSVAKLANCKFATS